MSDNTSQSRTSLIEAVKTPLSVIVLAMIIYEVGLLGMSYGIPDYRYILIPSFIISTASCVLIVVMLAIFKPEALTGERPWQETYATHFADDLYMGLEGAFSNLDRGDQTEAWLTVGEVVETSTTSDKSYAAFCKAVGIRIKSKANFKDRLFKAKGAIVES